jgi:hypothetical protein
VGAWRRSKLRARTYPAMNLSYPISIVEARDEIEPSNKALQTLPFSFRVPRHSHNDGIVTTAKQALQEI